MTGRDFSGDESGATAVFTALALVTVIGLLALGLDTTVAFRQARQLQDLADEAAISAALALRADPHADPGDSVHAVLARLGADATTDIEWPPAGGALAGNMAAVRVRISAPSKMHLTSVLNGTPDSLTHVASTATLSEKTTACLLALGSGASLTGQAFLSLQNCSALSLAEGLSLTRLQDADPWADFVPPNAVGCQYVAQQVTSPRDIIPGTVCAGLRVRAGGQLNLANGLYTIASGALIIEAGGSIIGNGVTLLLRPGASITFSPGSTVALDAPSTGSTAGLVIGSAPFASGTSSLLAASGQSLSGAVHLPYQTLRFHGSGSCLQLIAKTIQINGSGTIGADCAKLRPIKDYAPVLAE